MKRLPLLLLIAQIFVCLSAQTQTNFITDWLHRTAATEARQPNWAVPVIMQQVPLIQVVRTDILRQVAPARTDTWNFDGSKGFNVIPFARSEFAVNLPPYLAHNAPASKDGFGDLSFFAKYRFASANNQQGNYAASLSLLVTVPTGSYKNGAASATFTPTLGAGKGFGPFDLQTTLGATLPTGSVAINTAGRPVIWNSVVQYHVGKYFWPEVESNATYFNGGNNGGKVQEFISPGVMVGKIRFHPGAPQSDLRSRLGMAAGCGFQTAASQFHSYNHELVFTVRFLY